MSLAWGGSDGRVRPVLPVMWLTGGGGQSKVALAMALPKAAAGRVGPINLRGRD